MRLLGTDAGNTTTIYSTTQENVMTDNGNDAFMAILEKLNQLSNRIDEVEEVATSPKKKTKTKKTKKDESTEPTVWAKVDLIGLVSQGDKIPAKAVLDELKEAGFQWNRFTRMWYGEKAKLPSGLVTI